MHLYQFLICNLCYNSWFSGLKLYLLLSLFFRILGSIFGFDFLSAKGVVFFPFEICVIIVAFLFVLIIVADALAGEGAFMSSLSVSVTRMKWRRYLPSWKRWC